jgi:hypothetical protein
MKFFIIRKPGFSAGSFEGVSVRILEDAPFGLLQDRQV